MRPRQARNNNGQALTRQAKFCGNAANESNCLLDDLPSNAGSTTYAERKEGRLKLRRINGLQNAV
jgi:hypothetical protein